MAVNKAIVEQQLQQLGDFHRFFTSKEIRYLPDVLTEGETIHAVTSGFFEAKTWLIVVTNIRLIFLDKGLLFGLKQLDLPLSKVSSVSQRAGLFFGEIEVAALSGSKKISSIPKRDIVKISSIIASLIHGGSGKPSDASASSSARSSDLASQLERLDGLYQKGVLTDDEFRLFKAKLLGS